MRSFDTVAGPVVLAMEAHARLVGASGVILVARMDPDGTQWESQMKVVGKLTVVPVDPQNHTWPGYNFLAIASSKAAEMADTKASSGSRPGRPVLQGEFGYRGGLIHPTDGGWLLTVFSGATGDLDSEIAQQGWLAHERG